MIDLCGTREQSVPMATDDGLKGTTVVVTRPPHQAADMIRQLEQRGARAVAFATVAIGPPAEGERARAREALRRLPDGAYRGLIVTSANAVRWLLTLLDEEEISIASVPRLDVFAIGDATAGAVRQLGVEPIIAEKSVGEGMVDTIASYYRDRLPGSRFLLPRAREGRMTVVRGLEARGAAVDVAVVYATVPVDDGPPLPESPPIDWVTFTSPSAAKAFVRRAQLPPAARVAVIGPTTARAVREMGLPVHVVPEEQSLRAMLDAMASLPR